MGRSVVMVAAALAVAAIAGLRLDAQKPERQREVKIPGIDVSLKAGWQLLFRDGCRFAVPGSWRANGDASLVLAPDGGSLSVRTFRITSWSTHKAQIRAAFGHLTIVHEDNERRFWFEIGDKPRVQHFIDVSNGLSVCSGLLEIRAATTPDVEDTTRRIVESIGPGPERWPPDSVK
jgi:hypothetical protein